MNSLIGCSASRSQAEKLCDWSNKNIISVVFNEEAEDGVENKGSGPRVRNYIPIDEGAKYTIGVIRLYDSPILEIGEINGVDKLHKTRVTWVEWDHTGHLLATADDTGCVALWKLETVSNDMLSELVCTTQRRIITLKWLSSGIWWILRKPIEESYDSLIPNLGLNCPKEIALSNVIENDIFHFFLKEQRKGPELKTSVNALCFLNEQGKFYLVFRCGPTNWGIKNLDVIAECEKGYTNGTVNNDYNPPLKVICADIYIEDNSLLVAAIYKGDHIYDKPRLILTRVIYTHEENLNTKVVLRVTLDDLFCSINENINPNIDCLTPELHILSEKEFLIFSFSKRKYENEKKDDDIRLCGFISIWSISDSSESPSITCTRKRTLNCDYSTSIQKFSFRNTSSKPNYIALVSNLVKDTLLYTLSDLNEVPYLFQVTNVNPNNTNMTSNKPINVLYGMSEELEHTENIIYQRGLLQGLRNIPDTDLLPHSPPQAYSYMSKFSVMSPNKVKILKFSNCVYRKDTLNNSTLPYVFVESEGIFLKRKTLAPAQIEKIRNRIISTLLDLCITSIINNVNCQDVVSLAHYLEIEYSLNGLLLQLSSQVAKLTNQKFPSYNTSLSLDGKFITLQISLCRYKFSCKCVCLDVLLQLQHLLECVNFSFVEPDIILRFSESLLTSKPNDFEEKILTFSRIVKIRYEILVDLAIFGAWFMELCAAILRSLSAFASLPLTEVIENDNKYLILGGSLFQNRGFRIFFIVKKKIDFLLQRKDIILMQNSAIISNLNYMKTMFERDKLLIEKFMIFLCDLCLRSSELNCNREKVVSVTTAILYDFKLPSDLLQNIQTLRTIFNERISTFFSIENMDITSNPDINNLSSTDNLFSKPNSRLLSIWNFYSSLSYPEMFYYFTPTENKYFTRNLFIPFDILSKQVIPPGSRILVCNKCQRQSMDNALTSDSTKYRLATYSNPMKRWCICGGIWRRLNNSFQSK